MSMAEQKTAVVTGGAGFIGSHLCERLVKEGYKVISLDNYFTGSKDNHVPGVEYREGHTKDIAKHIPEDPDIIYHLGEYSRVEQSVLEPDLVHDLNSVGTEGVISFWRTRKCKLLYAGSSTKFGDGGAARYTSPYAESKAENSEKIKKIGDVEGLPYAITYFYNVYGSRERSGVYGTLIEHFKRMHLSGAPCAIVSPGTQQRNFTHVDDIVDGLVVVGERGIGDEFGLGCHQAHSIFEVAELFGFGKNIVMFPERTGNRMSADLDTRKIHELGWSTQRSLTRYISDFVKSNPPAAHKEKRILVFSTTFYPVSGDAEDAFLELAHALPSVTFDVITARFSRSHAPKLPANICVHRVGLGFSLDKFLLPILGPLKAMILMRRHTYLFAWSLMASYAATAAVFTRLGTGISLLITLADQTVTNLSPIKRRIFRILLGNADQVYATHLAQESHAKRAVGKNLARSSIGDGDAFANALRFAYADILRKVTPS